MDLEQQRQADVLALGIAAFTRRPVQVSAFFCEECDEAIPEARRRAVHGVTLCVNCQSLSELKSRHYQGGAK